MPRPGYTNLPPSQGRDQWIVAICRKLDLDPEQHGARLKAIDFALSVVATGLVETELVETEPLGDLEMKNIYVDTQTTYDYFIENVVPFHPEDHNNEVGEWYDRWLDWLIGLPCTDGSDIDYEYSYNKQAVQRLEMFGIEYEIR